MADFRIDQRVHLFGCPGTLVEREDFHGTRWVVRWDSGSTEVVEAEDLRDLSNEDDAVLRGE